MFPDYTLPTGQTIAPATSSTPTAAAILHPVSAALNQVKKTKPFIELPSFGVPAGAFAQALGTHLKNSGLYRSNREVGTFRGEPIAFEAMSPATFRTFIEKFVTPARAKDGGKELEDTTMSHDDAVVTLASDQFLDQIPEIKKVLACQLG